MSNTIVEDNGDSILQKKQKRRKIKSVQNIASLVGFKVIGEDNGMLVVQVQLRIGGVVGTTVTYIGPLQAVSSDFVEEKGPIIVTLPNLEKSE